MRDDERSAIAHQPSERGLNLSFGLGVQGRGRLIEDQDRCVLQQRTRDRDALTLTARQQHAAIADHRIETGRLRADELRRVGCLGGSLDVLIGGRASECDVVADAVVEQHDVLTDYGDLLAQIAQIEVA